jgi:hypothetical protein
MADTPIHPRPTPAPSVGRERGSLPLRFNHPKNYLGVPLAAVANEATTDLIQTTLVADTDAAVRGAAALDLIDTGDSPTHDPTLTGLGEDVVTTVTADHTPDAALDALSRLHGRTERFVTAGSRYWEPILTRVYQAYQPAATLVTILNQTGPVSLARLTAHCLTHNPDAARLLVSAPDDHLPSSPTQLLGQTELADHDIYYSPTTCQLKTQLWHAGILTERGAHSTALAPLADRWAVEPRHLETPIPASQRRGDR